MWSVVRFCLLTFTLPSGSNIFQMKPSEVGLCCLIGHMISTGVVSLSGKSMITTKLIWIAIFALLAGQQRIYLILRHLTPYCLTAIQPFAGTEHLWLSSLFTIIRHFHHNLTLDRQLSRQVFSIIWPWKLKFLRKSKNSFTGIILVLDHDLS